MWVLLCCNYESIISRGKLIAKGWHGKAAWGWCLVLILGLNDETVFTIIRFWGGAAAAARVVEEEEEEAETTALGYHRWLRGSAKSEHNRGFSARGWTWTGPNSGVAALW